MNNDLSDGLNVKYHISNYNNKCLPTKQQKIYLLRRRSKSIYLQGAFFFMLCYLFTTS